MKYGRIILAAALGFALGAGGVCWFALRPSLMSGVADRARAERESALASRVTEQLADSQRSLGEARSALAGSGEANRRLANRLDEAQGTIGRLTSRLGDSQRTIDILTSGLGDLESGATESVRLAGQALDAVQRAIAIGERLQNGNGETSGNP